MPETATAQSAIEATPAAVENTAEASSARVLQFAKELKNEHLGEQPAPAEETTETTTETTDEKPLDRDAIAKAFRDGDLATLAKLLGEKDVSKKLSNSDWAKFRQRNTAARREHEETQAQLSQERAALNKEREQLLQAGSTLHGAMDALNRGDYVTFLEKSTGKPIAQLIEVIADDLSDSSKREARLLRQQIERQEQERQEEKRKTAQENETREQAAARSRYMGTLKETLASDTQAGPILAEYGDAFAQLVFDEQARNWDGETPMPVAQAARNVIKQQRAYFERAAKVFGSLPSDTEEHSPGSKPAKQGSPGARIAPRKAATTNQGAANSTRELTPQEIRARFARELKAELSG